MEQFEIDGVEGKGNITCAYKLEGEREKHTQQQQQQQHQL